MRFYINKRLRLFQLLNLLFICFCSYMFILKLCIPSFYSVMDFPFTYPDIYLNFTNVTDVVNYYQSPELQNAVNYCNGSVILLIGVISQPNEADKRTFIRNTWGKEKSPKSELKFIVGQQYADHNFQAILEEQQLYKDLVITNVFESYANLTFKTLALLTLAPKFCASAKCILKVDSDNAIDISEFEKLCIQHSSKNQIHGFCIEKAQVFRRKFFNEKWTVPHYVYENSIYPTYCAGGNYMITGNKTIDKIHKSLKEFGFLTSRNKQKMPEDVLFAGIFAQNANVTRVHNKRIIPCIKINVDCIHRKVLPKNWISIRFGDENLPSLQKCCLKSHWKKCIISEVIQKASKF